MEIRVLGCYGSEYPSCRTTCFLINTSLVVDAGAMTNSLALKEQVLIDNILITHSHLDHILDIGFLADNVIGLRSRPVQIIGSKEAIKTLMENVLNNRLWPDFTVIPNPQHPVLATKTCSEKKSFLINGLKIKPVTVDHTVTTFGYIIQERNNGSVLFSGDTGPTNKLWETANNLKDLRAMFIELSFPDRLRGKALVSKHLTPQLLAEELKKIKRSDDIPIYLYHMKPYYLKEIKREIKALKKNNIKILTMGMRIQI